MHESLSAPSDHHARPCDAGTEDRLARLSDPAVIGRMQLEKNGIYHGFIRVVNGCEAEYRSTDRLVDKRVRALRIADWLKDVKSKSQQCQSPIKFPRLRPFEAPNSEPCRTDLDSQSARLENWFLRVHLGTLSGMTSDKVPLTDAYRPCDSEADRTASAAQARRDHSRFLIVQYPFAVEGVKEPTA